MSTATGPAYKIKPDTDLFTIAASLQETKQTHILGMIQEYLDYSIQEWLTFAARKVSDNVPKDFNEHVQTIANRFYADWATVKSDSSSEFNQLRAGTTASLIFYKSFAREELYVRLVDFKKTAVEVFSKLPFVVQSMEYYNGSDSQLNEMSEEEWHYRRDVWEEVGGRNKPSPSTVKISLVNSTYSPYDSVSPKKLNEFKAELTVPSRNKLLTKIFRFKYNQFYFTEIEPPKLQGGFSSGTTFNWTALNDIAKYSFKENNLQVLPGVDGNEQKVEEMREQSVEWLKTYPVVWGGDLPV